MSLILTFHSQEAYSEYALPAVHDQIHSIVLNRSVFRLHHNLEILLEEKSGAWYLLDSEHYTVRSAEDRSESPLKDGEYFSILSPEGELLNVIVRDRGDSLVPYMKYRYARSGNISIGRSSTCDIQYSFSYRGKEYISRSMATIRVSGDRVTIVDEGANGIYVGDHRVHGEEQIVCGDRIHIWGLDIILLNGQIAIRGDVPCHIRTGVLMTVDDTTPGSRSSDSKPYKKTLYHRAPRNMDVLSTEPIEIEAPPDPKTSKEMPLFLVIGPSMTMMIPMASGSILAIMAAMSSNGSPSITMFTGILVAVLSAIIGSVWAIVNLRYNRKVNAQDEAFRVNAYKEYLDRCEQEILQRVRFNTAVLNRQYPAASYCLSDDMERQNLLWSRNQTHEDFLIHRVGVGNIPLQAPILVPKERFSLVFDELKKVPAQLRDRYGMLQNVPISVDLLQNPLNGLVGGDNKEGAYAIAEALSAQIMANNCYPDVKLAYACEEEFTTAHRFGFAAWLPHVWSSDKKARYIGGGSEVSDLFYTLAGILRDRMETEESSVGEKKVLYKPHFVLFVEDRALIENDPNGATLMEKGARYGFTIIILAATYEELPNACECILQKDSSFRGLLNTRTGERTCVDFDPVDPAQLDAYARHLSNLEVNEIETGGDIPSAISFFDMYGVASPRQLGVENRWRRNRTYTSMKALVGQSAGGTPCYLDAHEKYHGPHGLVAGTTGSGKSETLQTYILSLAVNFSPEDVAFFLIDYKGGGMADLFKDLPHLTGSISNLSGNLINRAMVSIRSENRRRQQIFHDNGVNNINAYTMLYKNGEVKEPVPHLFIIIDEFAELKREQEEFMKGLISVAQVGRSLGVHLILATQKPSGTVDANIWSNARFKLCLRVQNREDSMDMLHRPDAAYLTQAGRTYLQVGNDELFELFQSGWSGAIYDDENQQKTELARMLTATGKTAMVGSYVKRRQQDQRAIQWTTQLVQLWQKANPAGTASTFEGDEISRFLQALQEAEIDFPDTAYNRKILGNFRALYRKVSQDTLGWNILNDRQRAVYIVNRSKAEKVKLPSQKEMTQLDAVCEYLKQLYESTPHPAVSRLWLPVLPTSMTIAQAAGKVAVDAEGMPAAWTSHRAAWELRTSIGYYDDPANQQQGVLEINFTRDGSAAVCGTGMSGKSTFLQSVVYGLITRYSPQYLSVYMLDFSSRMLQPFEEDPHVGGVLYAEDLESMNKFFWLLGRMMEDRRKLFRGGNYWQYVKANGVVRPAVLICIDNMAAFREKTENRYDEELLRITRECSSLGIYFLISGGGFGAAEIPTRMRDFLPQVFALEQTDRYQYAELMGQTRVDTEPEAGIRGRGLAMVSGEPLEFQTLLAVAGDDDYRRGDQIRRECAAYAASWKGSCAQPVPRIPEDPDWARFSVDNRVRELLQGGRMLPYAYEEETAEIESIDLAGTYTWMVLGPKGAGKTSLLRNITRAAAAGGAEVFCVDMGRARLQAVAQETGAAHISGYAEFFSFMKERMIPEFVRRAGVKKELLAQGLEDEALFEAMRSEPLWFIVIDDLAEFAEQIYLPENAKDNVPGALNNLLQKGAESRIYFIAGMRPERRTDMYGKDVYDTFAGRKQGICLGGPASASRIFDFNDLPFAEQNARAPLGTGYIPTSERRRWHKVIVPSDRKKEE